MVSRETKDWKLNLFFRWYEKNILTKQLKNAGPLSIEAVAITLLSKSINSCGFFIIKCADENTAEKLYTVCYGLCPDFSFFLPGKEIPGGEVPGFISERQRYLEESFSVLSLGGRRGLLFTTPESLKQYSAPSIKIKEEELFINIKKKIKMGVVVSFLNKWGYRHTERVLNPLYYTIRGGIIDVFLIHSKNPVRIEFFGEVVESIRLFSPYSQRTIKKLDQIVVLPRFLEIQKRGESLISFISSDNSIKVYNVKSFDAGRFQIQFNGSGRVVSNLKSDNISKNVVNNMFRESGKPKCVVFTENLKSFRIPSYLPEKQTVCCVLASLERGFCLKGSGLIVFGAKELPVSRIHIKSRWLVEDDLNEKQNEILDISDLEWGEPLVHEDFGVGAYRGLEKAGGNECVKLKYADGGFVYVPVYSFNKIHRLVGVPGGSEKLSSLRKKTWGRRKAMVKIHAKNIAIKLLKTHALRQASRGFLYEKEGDFYRAVCESFPFQETEGQISALRDVVSDMEKPIPLDRLVCGDVGFGKTEIAIRASIKAVESGKIVFVLAPTTVLAGQHYFSFEKRFSPLGIHVELLSRFRTVSEQKKIVESVACGNVDVLIGTHRLISGDVETCRLGLVVIDEEHLFGVKHKEKIKSLKSQVDVLTLTATPIPRTLKQSLVGLKNISIINTPPKARRPVKTFVDYLNWKSIIKIIKQETVRGGQVYFIHNNIGDLSFLTKKIRKQFPEQIIQMAHGKMKNKTLESIMIGFFKNEIDVLCCTTIVGSGLDVSNANTVIINNAHRFGLSQLYQLRGRVGRGSRQAFCYMFIPEGKRLESNAFQRLKTMEQNTRLGSGYKIALKDMNIRGAGDVFGTKQSGVISSVGFHMYNKILKEVLDEERGVKKKRFFPIITSEFSSGLPEDFVPLTEDRLYFYQSLSLAESLEKICDIKEEIIDRFGPVPNKASLLLDIAMLRVLLSNTSVKKVFIRKKSVELTLWAFSPYKGVGDFFSAVSTVFRITIKNITLKNKKNKTVLVTIGGLVVTTSYIKKIYVFLEILFLKKEMR